MAIVFKCDRCGAFTDEVKVMRKPAGRRTLLDTTNEGTGGSAEICDLCANEFDLWWRMCTYRRIPS